MTTEAKTFSATSTVRTGLGGFRRIAGAATVAGALLAGLAASGTAHAMELNAETGDTRYLTAYAEPAPERFGALLRDEISPAPELYFPEGEHELNDAWLGMSVISEEGVNVGYVIDAYIDEDGMLDELVLMPADAETLAEPVFVPARFARLGNTAVQLDLTVAALETLEIAADYAMLEE